MHVHVYKCVKVRYSWYFNKEEWALNQTSIFSVEND